MKKEVNTSTFNILIKNYMASIIKWDPRGDIDRFFDNFSLLSREYAADVYEEAENIIVLMNLPGIDPEKINIDVEDNNLRISAEREEETEEKKKHYYSREIKKGSFERNIKLPSPVEKEKVTAEFKNGRLTVTLPKTPGKSNRIKVEVKQ